MIRFVEMVGIELNGNKSFGFYNTVEDKFINMNGCHAVDSVEEFKEMYSPDCGYSYDRLFSLIPNKWLTVAEKGALGESSLRTEDEVRAAAAAIYNNQNLTYGYRDDVAFILNWVLGGEPFDGLDGK